MPEMTSLMTLHCLTLRPAITSDLYPLMLFLPSSSHKSLALLGNNDQFPPLVMCQHQSPSFSVSAAELGYRFFVEDESRKFYTEFLGFDVAMDMGWVLTFASPSNPTAQITLVRGS